MLQMILLWLFLKYRKAQGQTLPFQEHPGLFSLPYSHFYYCWSYSEMDTGLNYTYKRLYWRRPVSMEAHRGSSLHPSAGHWEKRTGSGALSHCWWRWRSLTGNEEGFELSDTSKEIKKRDISIFLEILFTQREMFFPFPFFFFI